MLSAFPVVAVTGARQVGKSTLLQEIHRLHPEFTYTTLDDRTTLDIAIEDPDGFISSRSLPLIIDEAQRAPDLMRAIKKIVDKERRPGMFLLSGSANFLTLKTISESLAGRVALLELYPFSLSEIYEKGPPDFFGILSSNSARKTLEELSKKAWISLREWESLVLKGGFPPVYQLKKGLQRQVWFESYRKTYLERDLRDLTRIENLVGFGRVLTLCASRTSRVVSYADLARDADLSPTTLRRYLEMLKTTYQIELLPPYFANIGKRLVKSPKLFFCDSGFAAYFLGVAGVEEAIRRGIWGNLVETWVYQELKKILSLSHPRTFLYYWRTHAGGEVDFVLERGNQLIPLEVKAGSNILPGELKGLKTFMEDFQKKVTIGIVLYTGSEILPLTDKIIAIPLNLFFIGSE